MKKSIKVLALVLALSSAIPTAVACGGGGAGGANSGIYDNQGGEGSNKTTSVDIFVYNAGYGIAWLDEMITAFNAKTGNKYTFGYNIQSSSDNIESIIRAGSVSTYDLYVVGEVWDRYIELGAKAVSGYDYCLEPLDDVYASTVAGESVTVEEKMWDTFSDYYKMEVEEDGEYVEHHYAMPWASGWNGLFYNKNILDKAGLTSEPRTTDELYEYCETLKTANKDNPNFAPVLYSAAENYIEYMSFVWWGQYSTINGIYNWHQGKTSDTMIPNATDSRAIFDDEGLYEMLCAIENFITPKNGYVYEYAESLNYTQAQARFFKGQAAFMPNGDWLENEMDMAAQSSNTNFDVGNIQPMKNPIISALSDKMSYWAETTNYTQAKATMTAEKKAEYDLKLRALVDYVDGVAEKPAWATDSDVAIMQEARSTQYTIGMTHSMAIPVYSPAKAAAKEFLKFMATDEAIEIYMNNSNGCTLPYSYDYTKWDGYAKASPFSLKRYEIFSNNPKFVPFVNKFDNGWSASYNLTYSVEFGSQDAKARITPAQHIENLKKYYTVSKMAELLERAGLA